MFQQFVNHSLLSVDDLKQILYIPHDLNGAVNYTVRSRTISVTDNHNQTP